MRGKGGQIWKELIPVCEGGEMFTDCAKGNPIPRVNRKDDNAIRKGVSWNKDSHFGVRKYWARKGKGRLKGLVCAFAHNVL